MIDIQFLLACILIGVSLGFAILKLKAKPVPNERLEQLNSLYKSVNNYANYKKEDELEVPIKQLFVYPCRGIPGAEVDELELGEHGIRYDRIFIIIDIAVPYKHYITSSNSPEVSSLRQKVVKKNNIPHVVLSCAHPDRLTTAGLPLEIEIDMQDTFSNLEFYEANRGYKGYRLPENISKWLSAALKRDAILIRAQDDRLTPLDPERQIHLREADRKKTFTTDAALHMINLNSVRELRQRTLDRYANDEQTFYVEHRLFRANILIDTPNAFDEDTFIEMRLGSMLLRCVGPCIRCKAIQLDYDKFVRNVEDEPSSTLGTFRHVKGLGSIFGMYYQMELQNHGIYNQVLDKSLNYEPYDVACKDHPITEDKIKNRYVRVKVGDCLKVRHQEAMDWKKSLNKQ